MLDLQPIKDRLMAATPEKWYREVMCREHIIRTKDEVLFAREWATEADTELVAHSKEDIAALVAELERLRVAIQNHQARVIFIHKENHEKPPRMIDHELWEVLDA